MTEQNTSTTPTQYPIRFLQFGTGNFLRAFCTWMVQCLNEQQDFNGGVIVIKNTASVNDTYKQLIAQKGIYHISTRGIDSGKMVDRIDRVDCIQQVQHPYLNFSDFLQLGELPDIQFIFSNTTEAGIQFNSTDQFTDQPASSFPGKLTQLLFYRFQHFQGDPNRGLTCLPCELIPNNGDTLRDCILQYAQHWGLGEAFQKWIQTANYFCNTLVDRIVPGFPREEAPQLFARIGSKDALLTSAEPYHFWAIQAPSMTQQGLPLDQIGLNVVYADDLTHFRTLKVRILNGAHTAMVPLGLLQGITTVRETIDDAELGTYIRNLLIEEVLPGLSTSPAEGIAYIDSTIERFRNPYVQHRLEDIALNSIAKFKTRLLPSLVAYYQLKKRFPPRILRAFAALICFYRGQFNGQTIPLRDNEKVIRFFQEQWEKSLLEGYPLVKMVQEILRAENLWGDNLDQYEGFASTLTEQVQSILATDETASFR